MRLTILSLLALLLVFVCFLFGEQKRFPLIFIPFVVKNIVIYRVKLIFKTIVDEVICTIVEESGFIQLPCSFRILYNVAFSPGFRPHSSKATFARIVNCYMFFIIFLSNGGYIQINPRTPIFFFFFTFP